MIFEVSRIFRRTGPTSPENALASMLPLTGGVAYANVGTP